VVPATRSAVAGSLWVETLGSDEQPAGELARRIYPSRPRFKTPETQRRLETTDRPVITLTALSKLR
jgi:hypothetical protein